MKSIVGRAGIMAATLALAPSASVKAQAPAVPTATPAPAQTPAATGRTQANPVATPAAFGPSVAPATATGRIEGQLFERGTKKPLADVNVFVLPAKLKGTTDAKGRFVIEGVPEGEIQFVVNASGYQRLEKSETFKAGAREPRKLYLERASYQGFETTILDRAKKRDDTTRTLKTEQFLTMPGSGGDPVKAVQNLPGVARAGGISSQVIIQGSSPQDTSYLIDEHPVPLVFHFGGLTSVVTPEAVDQVDYLSAGYGPEYGRAMGGIVGLRTRGPATDRTKGFVFADTTKAGGLIESPIDEKSSFWLSGRYSYIGLILKEIAKDNDEFDLTVAPSFADLSGMYERKVSDKDQVRVLAVGSRDELKFVLREPLREDPSIRGDFSSETSFYRLIPQWIRKHSAETASRWSLGAGQDFINVNVGDNYFELESWVVSQRGEVETSLSPEWKTFIGMDNQFYHYEVGLRLPTRNEQGGVDNPFSTGAIQEIQVERDDLVLGPYWRNSIRPEGSKWTYMPSLRVDYFNMTNEVLPAPRLAARYDVDESLFLRGAAGLYYQPPEPQETNRDIGNPDLESPYAYHFTLGAEKDFRAGTTDGFIVSSGLFYRHFDNLVIASSDLVERDGVLTPERYNNEGEGRAYGAEFMVRYDAKPWAWWLSYTISRSTRREPGQGEHLFQYDQTHNVNLVGSVDLSGNWKLSGRARYVTGNPYTPIESGSFDADNDVYVPRRGPFYSERLNPFFQVDVRADKKWVFNESILWAYVDIQNVTNSKNPEAIRYAYDYSEKRTINGLPILPTIGVRGDF